MHDIRPYGLKSGNQFKVYKKAYEFATGVFHDKYLEFVNSHLLELKPTFYAIRGRRKIETPDGVMYAVHLISDTADPKFDIIAECFINGEYIYLWQDKAWLNAVDEKGNPVSKEMTKPGEFNADEESVTPEKIIVLYQIGSQG